MPKTKVYALEDSLGVDKKSIETVFSIQWQSKTLFLSFFDPRSSIIDNVFNCRLPGVIFIFFSFDCIKFLFFDFKDIYILLLSFTFYLC